MRGFDTVLFLPITLDNLFLHRLLLLGCVLLDWILGSFYLFCGLFLVRFLPGVLWDLVEHHLFGLFFGRDRLCMFCLLLLLRCVCCFLCLLLLFFIFSEFLTREN